MKFYITFGQAHKHTIGGIVFDQNCIGVIEASSYEEGRKKVVAAFGTKFCVQINSKIGVNMNAYPRGFIPVPTSPE